MNEYLKSGFVRKTFYTMINHVGEKEHFLEKQYLKFRRRLSAFCLREKDILNCYRTLKYLEADFSFERNCILDKKCTCSKLMADFLERVTILLTTEIEIIFLCIKNPDYFSKSLENLHSDLYWTDDKINLTEIMYCVHKAKSINHGKVTLKKLSENFERFFNVDLGNFSDTFGDIANRIPPNRTKYLNTLFDCLNEVLKEHDMR